MDSEAVAAIIAAIIAAIVSFIVGFWTTRYNYKQLFAETVSSNRMEWINVWRENISIFLADAKVLYRYQSAEIEISDYGNLLKEFYKAKTMITARLNLNEENHALMLAALNDIDSGMPQQNFYLKCEYIENLAREILKPEWERVKEEARGKHKK